MIERHPPTDPREIVQLADRLAEVAHSEFPHLSPADTVFCLQLLQSNYIEAFEAVCADRGIIPRWKPWRNP